MREALDFFEQRFPSVWNSLWDIRSPFLISQSCCVEPEDDSAITVHLALADCIADLGVVMEKYG